jgi:hypothetical protein
LPYNPVGASFGNQVQVSKLKVVVVGIAVVLVIGALAWPVKESCGGPNINCMTGPDENGYVHPYYEVKPLGVIIFETVTDKKFPFRYTSGYESEKVRSPTTATLTTTTTTKARTSATHTSG